MFSCIHYQFHIACHPGQQSEVINVQQKSAGGYLISKDFQKIVTSPAVPLGEERRLISQTEAVVHVIEPGQ